MRWMQSNPLRLFVLSWFSFWLVVFIPGHTRGVVQIPGEQNQTSEPSCCTPKPSCCNPAPTACDKDDPAAPPDDPAQHCLICFLKARLTDPPPVTLYTPYLGELDEIAYRIESSIHRDLTAPDSIRGRGPPTLA